MKDLNKVVITGRLTKDPYMRQGQTGVPVTILRVASNGVKTPTFVNIKVFNRTAQVCKEHLSKGDTVLVEGRLNQFRNDLEIVASTVRFIRKKKQEEPF